MCLLVLAWRCHPRYRLVVAANRDEFHARAAAPLAPWDDAPGVVGGRDLQAMGAWFAVDQRTPLRHRHQLPGVRPPPAQRAFARRIDSRRSSPRSARRANTSARSRPTRPVTPASTCCSRIASRSGTPRIAPTSSRASCRPASTACPTNSSIRPGPSWCGCGSVSRAAGRCRSPSERRSAGRRPCSRSLADREPAPPDTLPPSDLSPEWARKLSAPFVLDPTYGTRCSTVLTISDDDELADQRAPLRRARRSGRRI